MATRTHKSSAKPGKLSTPARNHYFYGMLMDACRFELEQAYFNDKRWLLNRLALGIGVLCGLEVKLCRDGHIVIEPGVAIDRLGREIIVSACSRPIDPRCLTDECGQPTEHAFAESALICLAYHECESGWEPVLVGDCDTKHGCAPSLICERYKVLVLPADAWAEQSVHCELEGLFRNGETEGRRTLPVLDSKVLVDRIMNMNCEVGNRCEPDSFACVPLALVSQTDRGLSVNQYVRPQVYSNALLFQMIVCLAERVEECFEKSIPVGEPPTVVGVSIGYKGNDMEGYLSVENLGREFYVSQKKMLEVEGVAKAPNAIVVKFSKKMKQSSISNFTFVVEQLGDNMRPIPVEGTISFLDGRTVTFVSKSFERDKPYRITLKSSAGEICDESNQLLDGETNEDFPSGDGKAGGNFTMRFKYGA